MAKKANTTEHANAKVATEGVGNASPHKPNAHPTVFPGATLIEY
jgi:hypothetical protein